MSRIPTEIDELMWKLAEDRDDTAIEQFVERYAPYRAELMRRIHTVHNLRGAKRDWRPRSNRFRPTGEHSRPPVWRTALAGAGLVAVAALAFVATDRLRASSTVSRPVVTTQPSVETAEPLPSPRQVQQEPPKEPLGPTDVPAVNDQADPLQSLVDVEMPQAQVKDVITALARSANVKIDIAPGLQDSIVRASYHRITLMQALRDLGETAGFTAVPQDKGYVLIIPALDPNAAPIPHTTNDPRLNDP